MQMCYLLTIPHEVIQLEILNQLPIADLRASALVSSITNQLVQPILNQKMQVAKTLVPLAEKALLHITDEMMMTQAMVTHRKQDLIKIYALLLAKMGHFERAYTLTFDLRKISADANSSHFLMERIGSEEIKVGHFESARKRADLILPDIKEAICLSKLNIGMDESAEERAIRRKISFLTTLANTLSFLGNFPKAETTLEGLVLSLPKSSWTSYSHKHFAEAYAKAGNFKVAFDHLAKMKAEDRPWALASIACEKAKRGDKEESRNLFAAARSKAKTSTDFAATVDLHRILTCQIEACDFSEAEESIHQMPENAQYAKDQAYLELARALFATGNVEAVSDLKACIEDKRTKKEFEKLMNPSEVPETLGEANIKASVASNTVEANLALYNPKETSGYYKQFNLEKLHYLALCYFRVGKVTEGIQVNDQNTDPILKAASLINALNEIVTGKITRALTL